MLTSACPIAFMSSKAVAYLVSKFESELTGYWYSISQYAHETCISYGPTEYCLLDADRGWATTKEGDTGFAEKYLRSDLDELSEIERIWSDIITKVRLGRDTVINRGLTMPAYKRGYRKHDASDLKRFRKRYSRLTSDLIDMHTETGGLMQMTNLYIGSCHTSADCSIRFDYNGRNQSIDYDVKTNLCDSLDGAYAMLVNLFALRPA